MGGKSALLDQELMHIAWSLHIQKRSGELKYRSEGVEEYKRKTVSAH